MRRSVKIGMIACAAVASVSAAAFGSLGLWIWHRAAQIESFYQEHRLLREMYAVEDYSTNVSGPARNALLQMLPLETDKETAVAVLRREGFDCHSLTEPITDTRLRQRFIEARNLVATRTGKQWVDCQTGVPNIVGYKHWILELEFDTEAHLSDARVAIWNIFL
jgi:hypothetical protein